MTMGQALAGIEIDDRGDVAVLRPWGTLDLQGVERIDDDLAGAAAGTATRYVFDMERVSFMDGSMVQALTRTLLAVRKRGARMSVVNGRPEVKRLLAMTGLARALDPA